MSFSNLEIEISDLPTFDDLAYNELAGVYAGISTRIALVAGVFLLLGSMVPAWRHVELVIPIGLAVVALMTLYSWFAARAKRYAMREHDLVFESGLFWRSQTIQPFRRIQHVEIARGPIDKRAGLAKVKLFSAGSRAATFTIPGLPLADAEGIREFALSHKESV